MGFNSSFWISVRYKAGKCKIERLVLKLKFEGLLMNQISRVNRILFLVNSQINSVVVVPEVIGGNSYAPAFGSCNYEIHQNPAFRIAGGG